MPETAAGLAAAVFTLLGMLAALFGLVGSKPTIVSSPPSTRKFGSRAQVKKTTLKAAVKDIKQKPELAPPVAPAGTAEVVEVQDGGVKKRTTRSSKD